MTPLPSQHTYTYILLAAGIITLLAAVVPNVLHKKKLPPPVLYLGIGMLLAFAGREYTNFDVMLHAPIIEHLSEFVVIIALTNAGLKIKKPFAWETWKYSLRLLVITMPLTIIGAACLGWWLLGLAPAAAVLFGAIIAPTDPVLAADLQTSRPSKKDLSKVRLGLTSEAGINDGLAFPFTYFAILMVTKGAPYSQWIGEWFVTDVLYRITAGVVIGALSGWALYKLIFRLTSQSHHYSISRGILSLSLTLLPYALTELLGGYGFIAVFVAACVFSNNEDKVEHMDTLHDFTEEIERIFVAFLFIVVGVYVFATFSKLWDWTLIATALLVVFVLRPLSGWVALYRTDLSAFQKFALSFYGIRGVGSIYYLMFAFGEAHFAGSYLLIQLMMVVIVLSVLVHGVSAGFIAGRLG